MFSFQGFPMVIVIVLVVVAWASFLSVVFFNWRFTKSTSSRKIGCGRKRRPGIAGVRP